ncbi:MAG TPA: glycosyltransferase family 4 protein [Gammaproteobacteria bacterium]
MLADVHDVSFISLYETKEEISQQNINHLQSICKWVEFHRAPSKQPGLELFSRLIASIFSLKPYIIWRHYSRKFHKRVKDLINSNNFDLILLDNLPIAYCIVKDSKTPQMLTDHDVSYIKCSRMAEQKTNYLVKIFYYLEAIKLKYYEKEIIGQVSMCITVSESDKITLQGLNPGANLIVIENGVDIDEFNVDSTDSIPTELLWFGGFSNGPNKESMQYYIEKIHHLITKEIPSVRLEILGGGDTNWISKITKNDKSLNARGYVEDIMPYAKKAGIFISPITSGGGTKLKVIEAMAFGKAIVTTSIGCEGIEGENGKEYLIADTPIDFAKAVINLAQNEDLRNKIGKNARKHIENKYDWRLINNKLSSVFNDPTLNRHKNAN